MKKIILSLLLMISPLPAIAQSGCLGANNQHIITAGAMSVKIASITFDLNSRIKRSIRAYDDTFEGNPLDVARANELRGESFGIENTISLKQSGGFNFYYCPEDACSGEESLIHDSIESDLEIFKSLNEELYNIASSGITKFVNSRTRYLNRIKGLSLKQARRQALKRSKDFLTELNESQSEFNESINLHVETYGLASLSCAVTVLISN